MRRFWLFLLVLASLAAFISSAYAVEGSFFKGSGRTSAKPQSKLWFNDGFWWGILPDGSDIYLYKLEGDSFVKQSFADAEVDPKNSARADVVWNGTHFLVFMYRGATDASRFLKYSYDASTESYTLLTGFPLDIALIGSGHETAVLAQDGTGKAWVVYEADESIRVIWSTSADHTA